MDSFNIFPREQGYALDDTFFAQKLTEIIAEHGIKCVIETGVNEGKSTELLTTMVERVIAIENMPRCIDAARKRLLKSGKTNWLLIYDDSPRALKELVPLLDNDHTVFFLDAHWYDEFPLKREIAALEPGKGIIIVHDMLVPGKSFGYYDPKTSPEIKEPLNYEYIRESLMAWSPTHRVEYNEQADNSTCGIAYIFPR